MFPLPTYKQVGDFLWDNRNKLAVSAVCIVGIGAAVSFMVNNPSGNNTLGQELSEMQEVNIPLRRSRKKYRSTTLIRVNKSCERAMEKFLPTLRLKIIDIIDVSSAIAEIRQLRSCRQSGEDTEMLKETEAKLWETIKFHIIAACIPSISTSTASSNLEEEQFDTLLSATFQSMLERSYSHLLGDGLASLAETVKENVAAVFHDWPVKRIVNTHELITLFSKLRQYFESNLTELLCSITLSSEAADGTAVCSVASTKTSLLNGSKFSDKITSQTWDVLESPSCQMIYKESLDICFNSVFKTIQSSQKSNAVPLASIIPQFKSVASALLPMTAVVSTADKRGGSSGRASKTMRVASAEALAITSFHALDAFCIQLFDSLSLPTNDPLG